MPDFSGDLSSTDDDAIRAAIEHAEVPALLPALASALDDRSLVPEHLRPDLAVLMDPAAGLSSHQQAEARLLAFDAIKRLQARDDVAVHSQELDDLRHLLEYTSGGEPVDEYLELLREELALGEDLRAPNWRKHDVAPQRAFRVVIIGAGMSGLAAAHRLSQAGLDVVVLEKNTDVGGTWLENSYPGCRVDVSNHFYSYSFAQRHDWPEHFSSQPVLLDYFRSVAEEHGLNDLIRFGTEVTAIELDEPTMTWHVQTVAADGTEETFEAHAVVSAVGQLNRPNMPDIPGTESFAGPSFHSARWDHSVDLTGKRVVIIGTGASAAQFIPAVADAAQHLTVFQRTPAWFVPTPDYHDPVAPEVQWLFRNVPGYANWYRFWIFWRNVEGLTPAAAVDPDWDGHEHSVSQTNDFVRQLLTAYLSVEFADAPELLADVLPAYPPFAKRFIRDNGIWAKTLKRADVALATNGVAEITGDGVVDGDGCLHPADVVIYGTGFKASDFLMPMKVVGRGGVELHDRWKGDARAHLGITLPGFPNLFLLYGPNTNIVANGSITYFSECEVHYVLSCIEQMLRTGVRAIDPKQEVHDGYNERVDAKNRLMAWGASSVNSWYKNATGRTAQNWPFSLLDYWAQTRRANLDDYTCH
ncbi:MAG TPA: NAD(P)/FAD-dependent oxidoreductase [Acidimicrobiales bacterium]|nr:NAD(P)/FAD-dependent oxidoreductase [Acidimicrobiales bacterium]